jgi:hypothetical protein
MELHIGTLSQIQAHREYKNTRMQALANKIKLTLRGSVSSNVVQFIKNCLRRVKISRYIVENLSVEED